MIKELVVEILRPIPGTGASGLLLMGVPLTNWVVILTLILVGAQIYFLFRDKWWRQRGKS